MNIVLKKDEVKLYQDLLSMIELLNQYGLQIAIIDNCIFIINELIPQAEANCYTELVGRNITNMIINYTDTKGADKGQLTALIQSFDTVPELRRKYHKSIEWKWFLPKS